MSATMAGLEAMGEWLSARLFLTNFRPVPLTEHAVFAGTVYKKVSLCRVAVVCLEAIPRLCRMISCCLQAHRDSMKYTCNGEGRLYTDFWLILTPDTACEGADAGRSGFGTCAHARPAAERQQGCGASCTPH
jgi:hypothetical protein